MSEVSVTDRSPTLAQIARVDDLRKCLRPFLKWELAAVGIFDAKGQAFLVLGDEDCPLTGWEQLPPEAEAASRGLGEQAFGSGAYRFEARPAYAGADRVGVTVFACTPEHAPRLTELADALAGVMGALLQSGFATWVTSELHLAASESSYVALEGQNQELRRAVEHLRELDKLKSNFLATVSHELRTPLTSVIGFSEMLLQGIAGELNEEQREYTQTIFDRGEELLTLITQILEMSRMEMGMVHLGVASVEVTAMAERAMESVRLPASRASVTVRHEIPGDLPPVTADADKIHQVLVNLVSNAVKFTREGGEVVISAAIAPIRRPFEEEDFFGDEEENAVAVTVRDTGIGIPEEQLNQIFEAFYQVDASSTREHGGAGLGLSIVKKLIEAHGGEVWAESSVGVGTAFTFTLPQARVGAGDGTESEDGPESSEAS
jgi:signal transduction histidine kinase